MMYLILTMTSAASAAELHTCNASLSSTGGTATPLAGFGSTEAEARRAVRQSARLLADQRVVIEAGLAWAAGSTEHADSLAGFVGDRGTPELAAPGWTLKIDGCSSTSLEDSAAWSARWSSSSETVTRITPADAIEASRRRACFTLYQVSFMQTLKKAEESGDLAGTLSTWEGAWSQLAQCFAGSTPTPIPATAMGPDSTGPARCAAIGPDGNAVAMGFGSTAERAAEDALRQSVIARTRRIIGQMGRTKVVDPPAGQSATHLAHLSQIATFTGASDAVDRARLACATLTPSKLTWYPTGRLATDCNRAAWTERPTTTVAPADAGAFLDTTCTTQVDPTMQIIRFSLRGTEGAKRDGLVGSAFRVSATCEAACYSDAVWGSAPKPFTLAGVANRTDKRKVIASLKAAADGGAPLAGLELLPTQQDPAALGLLFSGETWTQLKAEFGSLPSKADRWKQLEGHWILLP